MIKKIDMRDMRHINLFSKVTGINTRYCFPYNQMIFFCVPLKLVPKAIGKNNRNLKALSEILRKKVRIVPMPENSEDIERFVKIIINPIEFKELEVTDDEVTLTAGSHNKAALIGRDKRRLAEMEEIIRDFFGKNFKIV